MRCHEVPPLQVVWIQKCGNVWFVWFDHVGRALVGHRRCVVLVREPGEVVAEFVHEQVGRPLAVRCRCAEQAIDTAAAIGFGIGQDFDEIIGC